MWFARSFLTNHSDPAFRDFKRGEVGALKAREAEMFAIIAAEERRLLHKTRRGRRCVSGWHHPPSPDMFVARAAVQQMMRGR